jgi:hypothetical protein
MCYPSTQRRIEIVGEKIAKTYRDRLARSGHLVTYSLTEIDLALGVDRCLFLVMKYSKAVHERALVN